MRTELATATAAAAAAGLASDWFPAMCAGAATFLVAVVATAVERRVALNDAVDSFLAETESAGLSEAEQALALRVALDPVTLAQAKAAVRAAVREVLSRRGAGVGSLARAHAVAVAVARGAPSAAEVVAGPLPAVAVVAAARAASAESSERDLSSRELQEVASGLEASDTLAGTAAAVVQDRSGGAASAAGRAAAGAGRSTDD